MVLADLGRKITTALRSLSNATVINEEVSGEYPQKGVNWSGYCLVLVVGAPGNVKGDMHCFT